MALLPAAQERELHDKLIELKTELNALLSNSATSSQAVDLDQPIGRLSRMDALQQQAMAKANRAAHQRRLTLVDAALVALKTDRYGECRRCEEPIEFSRLQVRPESPFCLNCQRESER